MPIRKNFLLDDEIIEHLEKIAKSENTTQTNVIQNMIEEKYREISVQEISVEEKLDAFNSIIPLPNGSLVGKSIQSIKAEMGAEI